MKFYEAPGERPIKGRVEDGLDRSRFVERVTDALLDSKSKRARGVVLGITGQWGSGKSSVLNLIEEEIRRRNRRSVVIRFDPWVISGQQELIPAFLREAAGTIAAASGDRSDGRKLVRGLQKYAQHLAPIVDLAHSGLGAALRGALEGIGLAAEREQSLTALRAELERLVIGFNAPVIVLIDELDRVEDFEVRAVAQLVRAVGDFKSISYVLAYDPRRVARALGDSRMNEDEQQTHGRAYLEKIVQLPLALPVTLPEELRRLMDSELDSISESLGWSTSITSDERYSVISEAIAPKLASTPRDIKRLMQIFHPLAAMVSDEVNAVDILGMAALMAKAPQTMELLQQDPEAVVDDPLRYRERMRRLNYPLGSPAEAFLAPERAAQSLMQRLFPAISGQQDRSERHPNAVSRRRGLWIVLRLGLLPGNVSNDQALEILHGTQDEVAEAFSTAVEKDQIGVLLDRIADIYSSRIEDDDFEFWRGAAKFLNDENLPLQERFGLVGAISSNLVSMLEIAISQRPDQRSKGEQITRMLSPNDFEISPRFILNHLYIHGLSSIGRYETPKGGPFFISAQETSSIANNMIQNWRTLHLNGDLISKLSSGVPLHLMMRLDAWDDACRTLLANKLPSIAPRIAALLFPERSNVGGEYVEKLCGLENFLFHARHALHDDTLPPFETKALRNALEWLPHLK